MQLGPGVFEYYVETTGGSPLGHHSGDVEGNLMKFSYENTAGRAFALRDHADFKLKIPELSLLKGVAAITGPNGTVTSDGPNEDNKQVTGRDSVQFRLDVTNKGTADASSSRIIDELPPGITCADIVASSISHSGFCVGQSHRVEGRSRRGPSHGDADVHAQDPEERQPVHAVPQRRGRRRGRVHDQQGRHLPAHPEQPDRARPVASRGEHAGRGGLRLQVTVRCATVVKERTTSVSEPGNAAASEAAIGETIHYTVTTTIPEGTTMYGPTVLLDNLGARQTLVVARRRRP